MKVKPVMTMKPTTRPLAALALAASLSPALAQNQVSLERPLDNNLQVGSGGYNQPVQDQRIDGNALVTGNVGGLGYFHDDVGYTAPGEFRDRTSGDDNFRFRAISLPPSVNLGGGQRPVQVYRDYTASTPTGALSVDSYGNVQGLGSNASVQLRQLRNAAQQGNTLDGNLIDSPTSPTSPLPVTGTITGSVQQLQDERDLAAAELTEYEQRMVESGVAVQSRVETGLIEQPTPTDAAWTLPVDGSVGADAAVYGSASGPVQSVNVDLTTWLGRQIEGQSAAAMTDAAAPQVQADQAQRAEAALFGGLPKDYQPGANAYLDLLRKIKDKEMARGEPVKGLPLIESPSSEAVRGSRDQRAKLLASELGLSPDETIRRLDEIEARAVQGPLKDVIDRLDYDLPAVASTAGDTQSRVNTMLRQADEFLAQEKYLDAEGRYRAALTMASDLPMAQVGLMHAQFGAGMIRSAAAQMRWLFTQYPQLIAARYDVKLLPQSKRIVALADELEAQIKGGKRPEPCLLYAYLGYQTDNREMVEYGLNLAEVRDPQQPLYALLRQIWLDQP